MVYLTSPQCHQRIWAVKYKFYLFAFFIKKKNWLYIKFYVLEIHGPNNLNTLVVDLISFIKIEVRIIKTVQKQLCNKQFRNITKVANAKHMHFNVLKCLIFMKLGNTEKYINTGRCFKALMFLSTFNQPNTLQYINITVATLSSFLPTITSANTLWY